MVEAHPGGEGAVPATVDEVDRRRGKWPRLILRPLLAASLVAAACAVIRSGPPRGAVLVTITQEKGVDTGNLLALPFVLSAMALVAPWGRSPVRRDGARVPDRTGRTRVALVPVGTVLLVFGALVLLDAPWWRRPGVALAVAATLLAIGTAAGVALLGRPGRQALTRSGPGPDLVVAVIALISGYLVDTALLPSGTVFGPLALAAWMGWARRPAANCHWFAMALVLALANVVALADVAGLDTVLANRGGGPARTVALGAVLTLGAGGDHLAARRGLPTHDERVATKLPS